MIIFILVVSMVAHAQFVPMELLGFERIAFLTDEITSTNRGVHRD